LLLGLFDTKTTFAHYRPKAVNQDIRLTTCLGQLPCGGFDAAFTPLTAQHLFSFFDFLIFALMLS